MTEPTPVALGYFEPVKATNKVDDYIDISADLATGEAILSVTFTVTDSEGVVVPGFISDAISADGRVDFRINAPETAGYYDIVAVFTINDGQILTKTAIIYVAE